MPLRETHISSEEGVAFPGGATGLAVTRGPRPGSGRPSAASGRCDGRRPWRGSGGGGTALAWNHMALAGPRSRGGAVTTPAARPAEHLRVHKPRSATRSARGCRSPRASALPDPGRGLPPPRLAPGSPSPGWSGSARACRLARWPSRSGSAYAPGRPLPGGHRRSPALAYLLVGSFPAFLAGGCAGGVATGDATWRSGRRSWRRSSSPDGRVRAFATLRAVANLGITESVPRWPGSRCAVDTRPGLPGGSWSATQSPTCSRRHCCCACRRSRPPPESDPCRARRGTRRYQGPAVPRGQRRVGGAGART